MIRTEKYTGSEIAREIEKNIVDNELATGIRLPTGPRLASRYSVSLKTVERAMTRLQKKGLISRVRGKGTFVLSSRTELKRIRIGFFSFIRSQGYVLDSELTRYAAFTYLQEHLTRKMSEQGYRLEKIEEDANKKENLRLLHTRLEKYDIILSPAGVLETADEYLRKCKCQIILILDDMVHHGPWHQVVYDYRPGFRKAIQLLRSKGFSKILVAGFANEETSKRRIRIFKEEALRMGIPEGNLPEYEAPKSPLSKFPSGQACAEYYLKNKMFDHAIFSTSDFLTIGMYDIFRKNNVVPGRDLKLISYDNFEGRIGGPEFQYGITGITHPQDEKIQAILAMLDSLEKIPSGGAFYKTFFVPATELVVRSST